MRRHFRDGFDGGRSGSCRQWVLESIYKALYGAFFVCFPLVDAGGWELCGVIEVEEGGGLVGRRSWADDTCDLEGLGGATCIVRTEDLGCVSIREIRIRWMKVLKEIAVSSRGIRPRRNGLPL